MWLISLPHLLFLSATNSLPLSANIPVPLASNRACAILQGVYKRSQQGNASAENAGLTLAFAKETAKLGKRENQTEMYEKMNLIHNVKYLHFREQFLIFVSKVRISIVFQDFGICNNIFSILCFFFLDFKSHLHVLSVVTYINSGRGLLESYEVSLSKRVSLTGGASGAVAGVGAGGYSRSKPSQQVCIQSYAAYVELIFLIHF